MFFLGLYTGVGFLAHREYIGQICLILLNNFPKWLHQFTSPASCQYFMSVFFILAILISMYWYHILLF